MVQHVSRHHLRDCRLLALHSGIPTGQGWDYMVPVSTNGQHGTYWWHSHANVRYSVSKVADIIS